MRIRIHRFTSMRIRIHSFPLMRMQILLSIIVMQICDHRSTECPGLLFEPPRLHCERRRPSTAQLWASKATVLWLQSGSGSSLSFFCGSGSSVPKKCGSVSATLPVSKQNVQDHYSLCPVMQWFSEMTFVRALTRPAALGKFLATAPNHALKSRSGLRYFFGQGKFYVQGAW